MKREVRIRIGEEVPSYCVCCVPSQVRLLPSCIDISYNYRHFFNLLRRRNRFCRIRTITDSTNPIDKPSDPKGSVQ